MNTLLFTMEYPPFRGGVANYYGRLVKYWPEPGNIFVLNNSRGELINRKLPFLKWLPAAAALRRTIKEKKIDHVIVGQIMPLGLPVRLMAKLYGFKYSVILHGLDFSLAVRAGRKKIIAGLILKNARAVICANEYTASLVKLFLKDRAGKKIITVNPGIEAKAKNSEAGDRLKIKYNLQNKTILLSVGRLVKRKGFDMVIEALGEILKQVPDLIYVILGNGEELESLKAKILNLKLNDSVRLITDSDDEERDDWYQAGDIFIMPAREINGDFEGFGIVYLEANLAGKPVIAGRGGGVGDAVKDGLNGLVVDPESPGDIAAAVVRLANDPDLRRKLGEQGRERALKEFDWKKQIDKIYKFIRL